MIYIFNKQNKRLGFIKVNEQISLCYNNSGKQIAKIGETGNYLYLYDNSNNLIAIYNGANTYNKHNNFIGKGNLIYNLVYPTIAFIK